MFYQGFYQTVHTVHGSTIITNETDDRVRVKRWKKNTYNTEMSSLVRVSLSQSMGTSPLTPSLGGPVNSGKEMGHRNYCSIQH